MELAGYFEVARRWWTTLLIATWVAGLAGFLIASGIPPTYEGSARVLVGPVVGDLDVLRSAGAISYTYAELATSEPALEQAAESMGFPAGTEIVARSIPNDLNRLLTIRAEHGDPEVAATIANVLAENLIASQTAGVVVPEGQLTIVEPALPDPDPVAPQVTLIAIIAAVTGLLGAAVLVLFVEYFGNTVNTRRELGEIAPVPILGAVALGHRFRPTRQVPTIVDGQPESKAASAVRFIATKIAYADADDPKTAALVVGCAPRDGSADLTLGVAVALARAGRRVVVVDANDEAGDLSALVGVDGTAGLSELLADPAAPLAGALHTRQRGPAIISRGSRTQVELVDPDAARRIIDRLGAEFEIVLVTAGPIHLSGNALVWTRAVQRVVVAVERDRAKRDDVAYAMENLAAIKSSILGTVFLDHAPRPGRDKPRRGQRAVPAYGPKPPTTAAAQAARRPVIDPAGRGRRSDELGS